MTSLGQPARIVSLGPAHGDHSTQVAVRKHHAILSAAVLEENKIGEPLCQVADQFRADLILSDLGKLIQSDGQAKLQYWRQAAFHVLLRNGFAAWRTNRK